MSKCVIWCLLLKLKGIFVTRRTVKAVLFTYARILFCWLAGLFCMQMLLSKQHLARVVVIWVRVASNVTIDRQPSRRQGPPPLVSPTFLTSIFNHRKEIKCYVFSNIHRSVTRVKTHLRNAHNIVIYFNLPLILDRAKIQKYNFTHNQQKGNII